jgi:hypothetical protein
MFIRALFIIATVFKQSNRINIFWHTYMMQYLPDIKDFRNVFLNKEKIQEILSSKREMTQQACIIWSVFVRQMDVCARKKSLGLYILKL